MIIIIIVFDVVHIIKEIRVFRYDAHYTGVTLVAARGDDSGVITIIIVCKIKHAILHDINVSTEMKARVTSKK